MPNLYIIPNFLSDTTPFKVFPGYNLEIVRKIKYFIAENPKPVYKLLKAAGLPTPFQDITILFLPEKNTYEPGLLEPLKKGHDMGLITDAGYPCMADPGESVILEAHHSGIKVVPLTGPSSITLALVSSGLNAEQFVFHGYLPVKSFQRVKKLKYLEQEILKTGFTQIFIETPYRTQNLLEDITKHLHPDLYLSLAMDITGNNEFISTRRISDWRKFQPNNIKLPTIFILGK